MLNSRTSSTTVKTTNKEGFWPTLLFVRGIKHLLKQMRLGKNPYKDQVHYYQKPEIERLLRSAGWRQPMKDHDDPRFPYLNTGKPWLTSEEDEKAFAGKKLDFPIKEIIVWQGQLFPRQ